MDFGSSDKTRLFVVRRCYLEQTPLTFCLTECPFRVELNPQQYQTAQALKKEPQPQF